MYKILIAEDEKIALDNLVYILTKEGFEITGVSNGRKALERLEKDYFSLVIADIKMPELDGLELLKIIRQKYEGTDVIIVTAYGSIDSAVDAMREGAFDYITKPFDLDELIIKIRKLYSYKSLKSQNDALKAAVRKSTPLVANSAVMREVVKLVESLSDSDCSVMLTGESGVGKTLVARTIHNSGKRSNNAFLAINCATLTEALLSSELFGYERGAFTGAVAFKKGLVEMADKGTLFLDEIGETSPSIQSKLLKFIEEGEFYRLGSTKPLRVNVRIIAATNKNLPIIISSGLFREDLYYRLNVMEIQIPPLRERMEDIEELCLLFLGKHVPKYDKKISAFSANVIAVLKKYDYPGNVRELENIIERAIILEQSPVITLANLPAKLQAMVASSDRLVQQTHPQDEPRTMEELNRQYALEMLRTFGGNKSRTAKALGISRASLWKILK